MIQFILICVKVIVAIGIVIVFLLVGSHITAKTAKPIRRAMMQKYGGSLLDDGGDLVQLVTMGWFICFAIIGVYTGLYVLGIRITSLLGTVSFVLGFVSQKIIRDYLIGLRLCMTQGMTPGQFIVISDGENAFAVTIKELHWQSATLKTIDGGLVRMPFSYMFHNSIFLYEGHIRMSYTIPASHIIDIDSIDDAYHESLGLIDHAELLIVEHCRWQIVGFDESSIHIDLLPYLDRAALKASDVGLLTFKDNLTRVFADCFARRCGIVTAAWRVVSTKV